MAAGMENAPLLGSIFRLSRLQALAYPLDIDAQLLFSSMVSS